MRKTLLTDNDAPRKPEPFDGLLDRYLAADLAA
jgi:hypothetical protein